jgi:preprotein translocase subunit YajC
MSPFIPEVLAAAPQGDNPFTFLLLMGGLFAGMYFFMIRPQNKRQKEHQAMVAGLAKGDEVVAAGGIHGRVKSVDEQTANVEISKGVEVKVHKHSVTQVLPKGTLKHI